LTVIVRDAASGEWRLFEQPIEIVTANEIGDVLPALQRIEDHCARNHRYAAGFLSYEAAPAFDSALKTQDAGEFPLLRFGIYDTSHERTLDELAATAGKVCDEHWEPSISAERYARVFGELQELIRNGDTYQVNYTYRMRARLQSDPLALFLRLAASQMPPFGAYVDTGAWAICSASPELFFHCAGDRIESRPMKGTAARGLWFEQDLDYARRLRESEKERSENVMIVDMVRNDLGRVARPGSVRVTNLFDVERYPTVLQLTSTVAAETDAGLVDVMRALFPAASITGAPKARTMEIIAAVECSPRRIDLFVELRSRVSPSHRRLQFRDFVPVLETVRWAAFALSGLDLAIVTGYRSRCTKWRGPVCRQGDGAFRRPSFQRRTRRPPDPARRARDACAGVFADPLGARLDSRVRLRLERAAVARREVRSSGLPDGPEHHAGIRPAGVYQSHPRSDWWHSAV
jgi:para-aminobenzoate synthetase / 4-amino-4-deoxychorismate lyase